MSELRKGPPWRRQDGRVRALAAKRTRCPRCMGKGAYRRVSGLVLSCGVCAGRGQVVPFGRSYAQR